MNYSKTAAHWVWYWIVISERWFLVSLPSHPISPQTDTTCTLHSHDIYTQHIYLLSFYQQSAGMDAITVEHVYPPTDVGVLMDGVVLLVVTVGPEQPAIHLLHHCYLH